MSKKDGVGAEPVRAEVLRVRTTLWLLLSILLAVSIGGLWERRGRGTELGEQGTELGGGLWLRAGGGLGFDGRMGRARIPC